MADTTPQQVERFIAHWEKAAASERANAQPFLIELCDLLGVPRPANDHHDGYTFEFPVKIPSGPGEFTDGRLDLYRRAPFVLEAKQFTALVRYCQTVAPPDAMNTIHSVAVCCSQLDSPQPERLLFAQC